MPGAKRSDTARRCIRSEICRSAGESGSEKLLWRLSKKLFAEICFFCALTPELSRPARCGPVGAETAKRARLERIVSALKLAFAAEWQERWFGLMPRHLSPRGGVSGPRYAGARARLDQGSSLGLAEEKLFAEIYFFCALTPELSRAAAAG